jgi:hypothetical protein
MWAGYVDGDEQNISLKLKTKISPEWTSIYMIRVLIKYQILERFQGVRDSIIKGNFAKM